jgi:hypothetical protein
MRFPSPLLFSLKEEGGSRAAVADEAIAKHSSDWIAVNSQVPQLRIRA